MIVSDIQLYEILSDKLGKDQARALTEFVEAKVEKQLNDKTSVFATKEDIASVRLEVRETEVRLTRAIYIVGVVQFLAIIGSVLMLLKYHL